MKILAAFLLCVFFLFFAGVPVCAQNCDLPFRWHDDVPNTVQALLERQNCLVDKVGHLEWQILDMQDELKQTELALHTAKVTIETLEAQMSSDRSYYERWLSMLMTQRSTSKPTTAAGKPKAPVNKPKPAVDSPKDR